MKQERCLYADVLRIISIISVVILHVASSQMGEVNVQSYEWAFCNLYNSLVRWGVPIFIMVSGMFLLDKEITISQIWNKYIRRIIRIFFFWSIMYVIAKVITTGITTFSFQTIKNIITSILVGHYHLWFLVMLIGLYMLVPILRKITSNADKKLLEYLLILCFVFQSIVPVVLKFTNAAILIKILENLNMYLVLGYVGYFIAGYYFSKFEISDKSKKIIYVFGILSVVMTFVLTYVMSLENHRNNTYFYGYMMPNTVFIVVSIFLYIKGQFKDKQISMKTRERVQKLASYSLGIYVIHDAFLIIFRKINITTISFNIAIAIPVLTTLVLVFSLISVVVLKKVKILDKFIS